VEYEEMIQKLEGDVRNHIRIEQQLKLHIESIQNKLEEIERSKDTHNKKYIDQIEQLKKEKRRMDELITIKENQLSAAEESIKNASSKIKSFEEEVLKSKNLEEKLKFMEKKYNKDIAKLQGEITLFKKYQ
jgi:hypothetical protein